MEERIQNLRNEALAQIIGAQNLDELENLRIFYLGRKGELNSVLRELRRLPENKKVVMGRLINDAKGAIAEALESQREKLLAEDGKDKWFDPTIPGLKPPSGHLHLVTQAIEAIAKTFERIGFVRARYPEVEWDWFAFESLNMPKDHAARDEWETFFIDALPHPRYGQMVLTPHTSSGQVREMQRVKTSLPAGRQAPIRMINIAKCFRRQSDVSHIPMFHQFEGLVIDKSISIAHLKGTLDYFARNFFGQARRTRLRPYHFQFTEPSFEVDVTCGVCNGKGCKLCKSGWLELGGAGMVHPVVLKNGGIDPKKYTGFAFGWGVERVLMMRSGLKIDDIRTLYTSDLRFLRQF